MKGSKSLYKYSLISQLVFDNIINTAIQSPIKASLLKIFRVMRRLILRMGDPLVRYNLNGTNILIPFSHELPYYRKGFPNYSLNVGRIAQYVSDKYPQLKFIDIGANIGDTVAILRGFAKFPILCIEGNRDFFSILQRNLASFAGEVYSENAFIGPATGTFQGTVQSEGGTAFLRASQHNGYQVKIKTLTDIFKEHTLFQEAKMIKIDTDGFDSRILISEKELLKNIKPVIFMEYDPYSTARYNDNCFLVFKVLKSIGYDQILVYDNFGDYVLAAQLNNTRLLEDIHQYFSGRKGESYADICAFHRDDADLVDPLRIAEIEFFNRARKNSPETE